MAFTVRDLQAAKVAGSRFAMMTAYDYTMARLLADAGIPVLLVGDSLGTVMLGYSSELPVQMGEMLQCARAVARAAPDQLLIGDMPFGAYHAGDDVSIGNAVSFLQAGMHAVKMEGAGRVAELARKFAERGIPVVGHVGLTPQFVNAFGGLRVQGRDDDAASRIFDDARALEDAGAIAIVIEGVPRALAAGITAALTIPTIGIGAGPDCDGQVLVAHDALGLTRGRTAKFVKQYADLGTTVVEAAAAFAREVGEGRFPDDEHSYH